jgi:hypothetical protein
LTSNPRLFLSRDCLVFGYFHAVSLSHWLSGFYPISGHLYAQKGHGCSAA